MRIDKDEQPVNYTATSFKAPYSGCETTIRRCEAFGYLAKREGDLKENLFLDILDVEGDILDTLELSQSGFEYLRRVLRFKRESTELQLALDRLAS